MSNSQANPACYPAIPSSDREKCAQNVGKIDTTIQKLFTPAPPFVLSAPSFVIPAGVAENGLYLTGRVPDAALLLFEARACLDYTEEDLPARLSRLPLTWHTHLPLDLDWTQGVDRVWNTLAGLLAKVAFLNPRLHVLHPPVDPALLAPLARRFRAAGIDPALVALENTAETPLIDCWDQLVRAGFSVCLDLGHMLAHGQETILDLPGLWERVSVLHLSAPGQGGRHESLAALDGHGRNLALGMVRALKPGRTVVLELFDRHALEESARLLAGWWNNSPEESA